jgi:DNA/RNA non-specific endonuclease
MPVPAIYNGLPRLSAGDPAAARVVPSLVEIWLTASGPTASDNIVETRAVGFSYLFDLGYERLIAAWGVSAGRNAEARDKARMQGHPLSAGPLYHRGHAIPHTLGGGTDINLVPQLAKVNVGRFRVLEKKAVATPGALYFTFWLYPRTLAGAKWPVQTPTGVDQGLLTPGQPPEIVRHGN